MTPPGEDARRFRDRSPRGIPLRALAPNAVTSLALCFGLTGVRFAIDRNWEMAVVAVIVAGVLDGLDGRIARLLKGESRFGAELDSLSDVIAFGVAPAVILYLWSLHDLPKFGWTFALAHAVCCALRLARFNAQIDAAADQPRKAAGFYTGVPAPAGAGLAMLPLYLWLASGMDIFRSVWLTAPWGALVAFLMVSSVATFGWNVIRLRRGMRFGLLAVLAIFVSVLIAAPWPTLATAAAAYAIAIPLGTASYARIRRPRAAAPRGAAPADAATPS